MTAAPPLHTSSRSRSPFRSPRLGLFRPPSEMFIVDTPAPTSYSLNLSNETRGVTNWQGASQWQELVQLRKEIERLAIVEDEDDEEVIPPASHESIERSLNFVEQMYQYSILSGEALYWPSVFATRDGGIQLFWKIDRRQTLLIFRPSTQMVEVGLKQPGELSLRQQVSVDDALTVAVRAMRNK